MAYAMLFSAETAEKGGRGKKKNPANQLQGFSHTLLSQSRAVLAFSTPLAERVRDGTIPLGDAFRQAQLEEGREEKDAKRRRELERERPDLAEMVRVEAMTLEEAIRRAACFHFVSPSL